jgi:hypothetical protein
MTLPVFLLIQVAIKNENSHQLAIKLKDLAKVYNMIIVWCAFFKTYIKRHMSSLEEVAPTIYADRVVILHNPIETGDKHMLGYETGDFVIHVLEYVT